MNWFVLALAAPFLWSVNNHIDKYLIERFYRHVRPGTLMIFTSIVSLVFSLGIWLCKHDASNIPMHSALIVVAAGLIYFLAVFPYIFALMKDETSRVVPLFQVQPLYTYFLALLFLHEKLAANQIVAGIVILAGAMLITLDLDDKFRLKKSVFGLMMLSTALFSVEAFLFKFVGRDAGFWSTAFYQYLGTALGGLLLLTFFRGFRQDFVAIFKSNGKRVFPVSLANESLNILARACFNYASLLAPLALVTLVNGFQPFFVIGLGVLATLFIPMANKESLLKKHLLQKIVSVIVIFAGTYLLFNG